jgi:hypothetical protein
MRPSKSTYLAQTVSTPFIFVGTLVDYFIDDGIPPYAISTKHGRSYELEDVIGCATFRVDWFRGKKKKNSRVKMKQSGTGHHNNSHTIM